MITYYLVIGVGYLALGGVAGTVAIFPWVFLFKQWRKAHSPNRRSYWDGPEVLFMVLLGAMCFFECTLLLDWLFWGQIWPE